MSTDLVVRDETIAAVLTTVSPDDLVNAVHQLVVDGHAAVLHEVARRADAASLYERLNGAKNLERHYAKMRLLAQAGLGVLSFDDPTVVEGQSQRQQWQALAAAYERGRLLSSCLDYGLSTSQVVNCARDRGYTWSAGIPWSKARGQALERGIALDSLPPDVEAVERRAQSTRDRSTRMHRVYEAQRRLDRITRQRAVSVAAKERGPNTSKAIGLLRATLQAFHEAQGEFGREQRETVDDVFYSLHSALDSIAELLGLTPERRS